MDTTAAAMVALIKHCGYHVFMRLPSDTYCYYTDGTRIGYAQWSQAIRVTTVHRPNTSSGTGFIIAEEITPETLRQALETHAPYWATGHERDAVRKYQNWVAYHAASPWNAQLQEV